MSQRIKRVFATAGLLLLAAEPLTAGEKSMAVTFDDLPGPPAGLVSNSLSGLRENTRKLLAVFPKHGIPVVGFVNEGKLFVPGESAGEALARTAILKMWVDAGLELGNHTYSHPSLNRTPLVHANTLNADYFGRLAEAIEARGYGYVSLGQALEDEAYRLPDTYVGNGGISWLLHWQQTAGQKRSPSPDPPDWVTRAYEALPQ